MSTLRYTSESCNALVIARNETRYICDNAGSINIEMEVYIVSRKIRTM